MSSLMREDWINGELGDICEINMGQSPPSSTYNINGNGLPFFQGKAEFTELYPVVRKWCSAPNKIAYNEDILISVRAPVGTTNIANQKCAIGRGLAAITYKYCFKYVFYYLRLKEQDLDKQGTGTTFRAISGNILKSQTIPLAPLPIQRAIVAKIETLFSDLDNGIANLKQAQAQLKIYRQAVLKKAFEGDLTKAWREQRRKDAMTGVSKDMPGVSEPLPTAEELLKQAKEERQNHYNQQLEDWKKAVKEWEKNGKIGKKPTKPTEYKTYNSPVKNLDLQIPETWIFNCIGNVCSKTEYGSSTKSLDIGDVPVIRMGNMQDGKIDWTDLKYSSNIDEINQYLLIKEDVLFNRTNSPELVGKTVQ